MTGRRQIDDMFLIPATLLTVLGRARRGSTLHTEQGILTVLHATPQFVSFRLNPVRWRHGA